MAAVSYGPDEFMSALIMADLPERKSTQALHGRRTRGAPLTLVDMFLETGLKDCWHQASEVPVEPAVVEAVMEQLFARGVTAGPVALHDLVACPACPRDDLPYSVMALQQAVNGPKCAAVDAHVLQLARAREAQIEKHPRGWGPEGPCASADAACYAGYLLLKSAGHPDQAMPAPLRVASVGTAFRKLAREFRW
jgi:hypothetical protein